MVERRFKGTSWDRVNKKWRARIYLDNQPLELGLFENRHEAAEAYVKAVKEFGKEHYLLEPNQKTEAVKKYRDRYKNKISQKAKDYRLKNGEDMREKARQKRLKIRQEILKAYGNKCVCCGENRNEFLSVDHTNGGGNLHRKSIGCQGGSEFYKWLKRNNFPQEGFRLLCHNCNGALGRYGFCPHQNRIYEG